MVANIIFHGAPGNGCLNRSRTRWVMEHHDVVCTTTKFKYVYSGLAVLSEIFVKQWTIDHRKWVVEDRKIRRSSLKVHDLR